MNSDVYDRAMHRLTNGGVLLLDGGVSTELQRRGVPMADELWSGRAALDHWEAVVDMHCAYIDAGADIITANTYASSRLMLDPVGLGSKVEEINQRSIDAALAARERSGAKDVLIAGSLSHAIPLQIRGKPQPVDDRLGNDVLAKAFQEMTSILSDGGVDLILVEMMSKPNRMRPLFEAVSAGTLPVWCGLSVKRGEAGKLVATHDSKVPFDANVMLAAAQNFDVWGIMHSPADLIDEALAALRGSRTRLLMAYPDSGYMEMPNWQFVDTMKPDRFAQFAELWIESGVQIVGGCCGLGPEHIT
ncbi:MAG: homocysteine S-methyltransferase family protein, partial [Hyphomicrobiaceae bacterium]